ncbi:MAG: VOC family protein [Oligoflexales bacterium]
MEKILFESALVTVGSNDFAAACKFYNELFAVIDIKQLWAHDHMAAWGTSRNETSFCVTTPYNQMEASPGNGCMVAVKVKNKEQVHLLHSKALELGAKDEGKPGNRGEHGFYGGYFRDLDGNKLNAYVPAG